MYEVFDSFCKVPTWDTSHPLDVDRFHAALAEVSREPGFSPNAMGEYIRTNHAEPMWPKSPAQLDRVISGLVREATLAQHSANIICNGITPIDGYLQ